MKKTMSPRVMMMTAMAIFGTLGLFVRRIPVSSGELALYRAILAALLIGAFLLLTKQKIPFAKIRREVPLLLASALGGAALLTLCDLLSRILFAPHELPVGIVLALVGGPFFIWLLLRQRGGRTHA